MKARRSASVTAAFVLVVATVVVGVAPAAAASKGGAPSASFARFDLAVITNDPAVFADADARVVYGRADFENVWLGGSAGIVDVIYPDGVGLLASVPNLDKNW